MATKTTILEIKARQVLDSRGNPTVEAEVTTSKAMGRASVPSGASKGKHEALELRDGGEEFHGKGVMKAVANVNGVLRRGLLGLSVDDQRGLDQKMISLDGTQDKRRLGANAILAVSMASARAAASSNGVSLFAQLRKSDRYTLPVPMMNVINGGEHAGNNLAIQEFLIEPVGASSCAEAIRMGSEVYQSLRSILLSEHGRSAINIGDEGGFAPPLRLTRDALVSIRKAVSTSGYGEKDVRLGVDAASSTFYDEKNGSYKLDGKTMSEAALEDYYAQLRDEFGLLTIEDPFQEEAFEAFASITKRLGGKTKVIGDDIYVTNMARMRLGIEGNATNAILIKLNQIGTVSETEGAIGLARKAGWTAIVSHRSGETEDPFIAHLATAFAADFIKTGAPARGERVAKYNELLRIEEELESKVRYAGKDLG
ncbi:MAG: phosphopyruvate hydratase [Nitrososphaerota archaeon]|nr:phosphopyruvate hydratase [Nitrososphaerota archaeon]MDG6975406.1 phosphopyruvate hydratase [Nitrososphaerota archaeon]MDG7009926.1 phosphopyruvate hydratase [Nitrososphaerota archaeon]MDG7027253.1 phosphopyruvate hydratase [Nitrososphaerota archaeon]